MPCDNTAKQFRGLQPHFSVHNKESLRVALIACLLFVSLEFFRGHYKTGKLHLESGLKLISNGTSVLWDSYDSVDQCILETFIRLQLQIQMFGQDIEDTYSIPHMLEYNGPTTEFHSVVQARQQLDFLLRKILHLTHTCHHAEICQESPQFLQMLQSQANIRAELEAWAGIYMPSEARHEVDSDPKVAFPYRFLYICHTMACIMVETLTTETEEIFKEFTGHFVSIIAQAVDIRKALLFPGISDSLHGADVGQSQTIFDIGWIPALYYTALKCRVHCIRTHAIKFLESEVHKEGIWDSRLAVWVALEVMAIEEGDFYKDFRIDDDFSLLASHRAEDLSLPPLPERNLAKEVEIILPDDPTKMAKLICKRRASNGNWEIITREFGLWLLG